MKIEVIGYKSHGIFVSKDTALKYACEQMGIILTNDTTDEVKEMLEEWFYSGGWNEVEQDEDGNTVVFENGEYRILNEGEECI
jgi:hypothetical protein